jgi:hypothetical protein
MRPLRVILKLQLFNRNDQFIALIEKSYISPHLIKSKGTDRTVEQLFNFKFEVFRSNLRLHWFSIGLRFRDEDP